MNICKFYRSIMFKKEGAEKAKVISYLTTFLLEKCSELCNENCHCHKKRPPIRVETPEVSLYITRKLHTEPSCDLKHEKEITWIV